ncbi:ABC transporter permease [Helicobacter pylori]
MSALSIAGVGTSLRVQWRAGWKAIVGWVLGLTAIVLLTTTSITGLYDTPDKLRSYAETTAGPGMRVLNGAVAGTDTLGGVLVNELGFVVAFGIPLLAIALTVRGTRREEEAGRLELLLASRVGRQAPLVAAVVVALAALVGLGVLTTLAFVAAGAQTSGSIAYGAALAALGAVFVGVSAVLAQAFGHQRSVWAASLAVALAAYLVRGAAAIDEGPALWATPLGWYDKVAAFGETRALPFALSLGTTALLLALALWLSTRRDVGGSLVPARTGPRRASAALVAPFGLAVREHRGTTLGWAVLVAVLMGTYGSLMQTVIDAITGNPDLEVWIAGGESGIVEPMAAMFVLLLSILVGGYVLQSLGSLRREETSGRLELQLSEARSRTAWLAPHLTVIAVGTLLVGGAGALALALSTAAALGDSSWVTTLLRAALQHLPVMLLLGGISLALFGWRPRLQTGAWVVFGIAAVIGYMGPGLQLPSWLVGWAPFGLVGNVPADAPDVTGTLVAGVGGLVLVVLGIVGFSRRDVPMH